MKRFFSFIVILASLASISYAENTQNSNRVIIGELKKLRAQLPLNDPARSELSLRIADRITDEAFSVKNGANQTSQKRSDAAEALSLYKESLVGLSVEKTLKVKYQMARLNTELGNKSESLKYFTELYQQNDSLVLKRESALRLAEWSESENKNLVLSQPYYETALKLCQGTDTCSYAHYKLAWIYKSEGNIAKAINEIKEALFDSKKQLREEALRDMILFMSLDRGNEMSHASYLENLSNKMAVSKPNELLKELAYSTLAAGNKMEAVRLMDHLLSREPNIELQLKYLEELYGLALSNQSSSNDYEKFKLSLNQLETLSGQPNLVSQMLKPEEAEKAAIRLCIQLDGDRTTRKERKTEFQRLTEITLNLFPQSKDRLKMIEGFIASFENDERALKLSKIDQYLNQQKFNLNLVEKKSLVKLKIGLLEKTDQTNELLNALKEYAVLEPNNRDINYAISYQLFKSKKYEEALVGFRQLTHEKILDQTSILSQNLILEILNTQKNYTAIQNEVDSFTKNHDSTSNAFKKEIEELKLISKKSEFEAAVSMGNTKEALNLFKSNCEKGVFLPQSCENAKSISVKVGDHRELISILKMEQSRARSDSKKISELADALEAGAYFKESAELNQQIMNQTGGFTAAIKSALFYEISKDFNKMKEVYSNLLDQVRLKKIQLNDKQESILISSLVDTNSFRESDLKLNWSKESQSKLAESAYQKFSESKPLKSFARKILLSTLVSTGPSWNEVRKEDFLERFQKERAIRFYGANGEKKFNNRVSALKKHNEYYATIVEGTPRTVRVEILAEMVKSYQNLADEILNSPLPNGLNEEQKVKISQSLAELSKPFLDQKVEIEKRLNDEKAELSRSAETVQTSSSSILRNDPTSLDSISSAFELLHQNPENSAALKSLKDYFSNIKNERIASYFQGRLSNLKKEGNTQ